MKKSKLAIILSKFETFKEPKAELEQYPFDGQSASEMLWNACQLGDIEGKKIGDLGCGTGILGIGALLLGAKFVYFIDKSEGAVLAAKSLLCSIRMRWVGGSLASRAACKSATRGSSGSANRASPTAASSGETCSGSGKSTGLVSGEGESDLGAAPGWGSRT